MNQTYVSPAVTTSRVPRPMPIYLAITVAPGVACYALSTPDSQFSHRHAEPIEAGCSDGLLRVLTRALLMLTPTRTRCLMGAHIRYNHNTKQLPVQIRASDTNLVEACEFLRQESPSSQGRESDNLRRQLQRFDIHWCLIPPDAGELLALQRWAADACVPGSCAQTYSEDSLVEYRARAATYEALGESLGQDALANEQVDTGVDEEEVEEMA